MTWRRQLPVASPISITAVARAALTSALSSGAVEHVTARIAAEFGADAVAATDSGTSALVLALRLAVQRGGTVGYPGYACVDLAAAAIRAGVRVRLYDLDPATLGPDLESVTRMLERGVDALVVSHLFGYPADVAAMRTLAERAGVPLIEDAAQGAGGTLNGKPLGSLGDLSVLSFGRGKGLCAGGGGALLGFGAKWQSAVADVRLPGVRRGWSGLASTAVQWGLGRPSLYAIPSMIPGLHLGEMVYHPAQEPASISLASSALIDSAFALAASAVRARQQRAATLSAAATDAPHLAVPGTIPGGAGGYLRFVARDTGGNRAPSSSLGVVQPYPQTLAEQPPLTPVLVPGEPGTAGSTELRQTLFTLPTHDFVASSDLAALSGWLRVEGRGRP